ncbi:MAG: hypothetical protein AAB426_14845 [Myxococcota bacterium]
MDRPYFTIDLVDDHVSHEIQTRRLVIGVYVIAGAVPRIVACGPDLPVGQHPRGALCLNEVQVEGGLDNPHRGHLTRWSVTTLTEKQLGMLYDNGFLDFERPGCYVELLAAKPALEEM